MILIILYLFFSTSFSLKHFPFQVGNVKFDQFTNLKSLQVPSIPSPTILYAISSIFINSSFSYFSKHTYSSSTSPSSSASSPSTLTLQIKISQPSTSFSSFLLTLSYFIFSSPPNIQTTSIQIQQTNYSTYYNSSKNFIHNNHLQITSFLTSFSSSTIARNINWYCPKFKNQFQFWTRAWMDSQDYIVVQVIMIMDMYVGEGVSCRGSYVVMNQEVSHEMGPYEMKREEGKGYLLGIGEFYLDRADFEFDEERMVVEMRSVGSYSFSLVVVNPVCQEYEISQGEIGGEVDKQQREIRRKQDIFKGVFIGFIVVICLILLGLFLYKIIQRVNSRNRRQQNKQRIKQMITDEINKINQSFRKSPSNKAKELHFFQCQQNPKSNSANEQNMINPQVIMPIDEYQPTECLETDVRLKVGKQKY